MAGASITHCARPAMIGALLALTTAWAPGCAEDPMPELGWATQLTSMDAFRELSAGSSTVKFTAPVEAGVPTGLSAPCYFQDMARYAWHLDFLREAADPSLDFTTYQDWVLFPESRTTWAGNLRYWSSIQLPGSAEPGTFTFDVYSESETGVGLGISEVAALVARLDDCAPVAAGRLAYAPDTSEAVAWATFYRSVLEERGVVILLPEDLAEAAELTVLSPGETYGTLTVFPEGRRIEGVGPRDVVIASSAPGELDLVAGLITTLPQNEFSHGNLRFLEMGVPNAVVPDIRDWPEVEALDGSLVRLVARDGEILIESATLEAAERFWADRAPEAHTLLTVDLTERTLQSFARIGIDDVARYGGKASGLGELNRLLPDQHRPDGFAIPFVYYQEHVQRSGAPIAIEALLGDPEAWHDRDRRAALLERVRDAIREAPIDSALLDEVVARSREIFGPDADTTRLRFRSSANSEDLDGHSGAGLHDSRSGCIADSRVVVTRSQSLRKDEDGDDRKDEEEKEEEDYDRKDEEEEEEEHHDDDDGSACLDDDARDYFEALLEAREDQADEGDAPEWLLDIIDELVEDLTETRTIEDAIRGVWASLWTERAFDDRVWWGIDHRTASMAIAVHPAYVAEQVNAVAITGGSTFTVASQVGYESVVEPMDPTASAEVLRFLREPGSQRAISLTVSARSSFNDGRLLWSDAQLDVLAGLLYTVHDHFGMLSRERTGVEDARFDVEIERTANGAIHIKQVRRYLGP